MRHAPCTPFALTRKARSVHHKLFGAVLTKMAALACHCIGYMLVIMLLGVSTFAPRSWISRSTRLFASTRTDCDSITQIMQRLANERMAHWMEYTAKKDSASTIMTWSSREEASAFVDEQIDSILFDCDGVLYRGLDVTPEAPACLNRLMQSGKQIYFLTNNAGQNRQQLRDKLIKILDCPSLTEEQMISSSYSCAQYLLQELPKDQRRIQVIGTQGLCDELTTTGFDVSGGPYSEKAGMNREELAEYEFDTEPVHAVVVGLDTDFGYRKLCIANVLLQRNPNALLVATNEDAFDLVGADARHLPGNGALVKALEHCSLRKAINVGKPSTVLASLIQRQYGLDPSRTLVVGDRLDTDIRFGVEGGMVSALVWTGCTTVDDLIALGKGTIEQPLPDVILPYMGLLT